MPDPIRVTRLGIVNAFLVHQDDGLTVVDSPLAAMDAAIAKAAGA